MSAEIKEMVSSCDACRFSTAQPTNPTADTNQSLSATGTYVLFSYAGKTYLVWVDRNSGMLWMDRLSSVSTEKVTALLSRWMLSFGYPINIRTDGGPQFRGPFVTWCASKGIRHEISSPYHPESNDHRELKQRNTSSRK